MDGSHSTKGGAINIDFVMADAKTNAKFISKESDDLHSHGLGAAASNLRLERGDAVPLRRYHV